MGRTYDKLTDGLRAFIAAQPIFFVASAPTAPDGHVNLSPKGLDTLRVLDEGTVAYLDFVGSTAETLAHLRDNGRITLMFCAFAGPPKVLRLYGRGRTVEAGEADFDDSMAPFREPAGQVVGSMPVGARAIVTITLDRIADSCGYGVPLLTYLGDRDQLQRWAARKGPRGLQNYQREHNMVSVDGLPALRGEHLRDADPAPTDGEK